MDAIERLKETAKESTNPLKAIKAFCSDCIGSIRTGKECTHQPCPLFDFREGKNPRKQPKKLSEDRRRQMAENMAQVRSMKLSDNHAQKTHDGVSMSLAIADGGKIDSREVSMDSK